ncbi:MAG: glycosyltransferase family 4 protein [Vulcanisaeta sp.]
MRSGDPLYYIRYGIYIGKIAKELNADMLYFPHEHTYLPLGFKLSRVKWTELLQTTPAIGALTIEDGHGFLLFLKNMKNNFNYGAWKAVKGYARLKLFSMAISDTPLLAVSRSIPYELSRLGVRVNVRVVDPGIGVDPCPYAGNSDRPYDVVFFARITPEKGIFDFLSVVKELVNWRRDLRALAMGFASEDMANEVRKRTVELGIANNVDFRFNVPRDEALRLLASSKVMVYPTRLDAFPLVVLEALSCGTPVIAYAIPAIRFNYEDANAVIKVKPLNVNELAIRARQVLENEEWVHLGREGIKFAEKYTWENVAKTEWQTLMEIINRNE